LSEKSVAAALKEGGYKTWHIGKWHLGEKAYYPENHGFDLNIVVLICHPSFKPPLLSGGIICLAPLLSFSLCPNF
jgi:hypothetical protein